MAQWRRNNGISGINGSINGISVSMSIIIMANNQWRIE
jgi:hypothetical protein